MEAVIIDEVSLLADDSSQVVNFCLHVVEKLILDYLLSVIPSHLIRFFTLAPLYYFFQLCLFAFNQRYLVAAQLNLFLYFLDLSSQNLSSVYLILGLFILALFAFC